MDFKTQFSNLNGTHYKEVKTSFYKLLHGTDPLDLVRQLPEIQPKNHLERIFYLDILIRLKQVKELVKILQDGEIIHRYNRASKYMLSSRFRQHSSS